MIGPIAAVGFHPDAGTVAAVAHGENAIRFWPIAPKPEPPAAMNHGDEVLGLTFLPGGTQLISAGDDNRILLWDVASGALDRDDRRARDARLGPGPVDRRQDARLGRFPRPRPSPGPRQD